MCANLDWGEIFIWGTRLIFFVGLIPQIIYNFINNSAKGLNNLFLLCFFNFYFSLFINSFLRDLPEAYRFVGFLSLIATLILMFQRFNYLRKTNKNQSESILNFFVINLLFYFFLLFFINIFPFFIISFLSLVVFISGIIGLVPQIIEIYKNKSVGNLSLQTILIMGFGGLIEFSVSVVTFLPLDIILFNGMNISCTIIFLSQYYFYSKKPELKYKNNNA